MTPEQLRQYLTFYQDLGVKHLYRRQPATKPQPVEPRASIELPALPSVALPALSPSGDTLEKIREDIGDCHRCGLCQQRNKIVFGSGDEQARLVFVGEGPGADEDAQGLPFVGRAGQLLTQMIENTADRKSVV